jgi:hypothetical protein
MNIRAGCSAVILGGLVAVTAPSTLSLAQSKDGTVATPKDAGTPAPTSAKPNTNTNPTKHRYWRHRGGKHPHYGSRRVGT